MEYRKTGDHIVVRIDPGEEILEKIAEVCGKEDIRTGYATGLGAADYVKIGLFDVREKEYYMKEFTEPMEITSLIGNISRKDEEPYLHFHINVCDRELRVKGGHLNACRISATAEILIQVLEGEMGRKFSEEIGLNLFQFPEGGPTDKEDR